MYYNNNVETVLRDRVLNKKYHFIAIGGIGMSGLAKYLLENGCEVSGSDIKDSKYIDKLRKLGAKVFIGHEESNLPDDCVVVASTAIKEDNPELKKAKRLGLSIFHRSDLLAEISKQDKFFIGYSGTHGKTTTSGLASYVLALAGYEPSFVVGGIIPELGVNSQSTKGKYFVAELDESDGTIVKYAPNVCVINNLEPDHLDFYKDGMKSLLETFEKFISNMKDDSIILINNDCEVLKQLHAHKVLTFGLNEADYTAKNIVFNQDCTTFDIYFKGTVLTSLSIILKGRHNVYNALSVVASLHQAGVDIAQVKKHFATFTGMGRRFQKVGEFDGITIYDDYAHHPTEIKATLSCAESFKNKRVIAVFQPHRYSRLKNLWGDFLGAFEGVDKVVVTDVYAASEEPVAGVTGADFAEDLSKKITVPCKHIPGDMKAVAKELFPLLENGDVVIGLGAGTITALGKELLALNEEGMANVAK